MRRQVSAGEVYELHTQISLLEQDGGGVGGRGVHLSPRIHQEYNTSVSEVHAKDQLRVDRST